MLKGLISMKNAFPFLVKGIHSDNGTEFINETIMKFAAKYKLTFTRGRPYKKNDNPHVEQKNYSFIKMAAPKRASIEKVKVRRPKELRHLKPKWRRDSNPDNPNPFLERQRIVEMRRAIDLLRKNN